MTRLEKQLQAAKERQALLKHVEIRLQSAGLLDTAELTNATYDFLHNMLHQDDYDGD